MADLPPALAEKVRALEAEVSALEEEARVEIPAQMQAAQAVGPVRENADLYLVAGRAHYVQGRLASLRRRLEALRAFDASRLPADRAAWGSTLELEDLDGGSRRRVRLCTPEEVEGPEACSLASPLGRALLGKRPGDEVEVTLPGGWRAYRVVSLKTAFGTEP
jgi:transcription elongation factor GreA